MLYSGTQIWLFEEISPCPVESLSCNPSSVTMNKQLLMNVGYVGYRLIRVVRRLIICLPPRVSAAGNMGIFCPLGIARNFPPICCYCCRRCCHKIIINPLLTKPARPRWRDIGLVLFLSVCGPRLGLDP